MTDASSQSSLYRLIYASAAKPGFAAADMRAILAASDKNNTRDQITGALLYADGALLQILEGDRDRVFRTFSKIFQDDRHSDVCLIEFVECNERQFPDWSMRHLGVQPQVLKQITKDQKFDPRNWTASQCYTCFLRLSVLLENEA